MSEMSETTRARNADRIREDGMSLWAMLLAAAMAGGKNAVDAGKQADQGMLEAKRRFT